MPFNQLKNFAVNQITNRARSFISDAIGGTPGLPQNRGSVMPSSANRFGRVNPYEGEMVTYPEDLGSEDQGHMVLFNINEQTNANINFGGGKRIRSYGEGLEQDAGLRAALDRKSPNHHYNQLKGKSTA